MPRVRRSRRRRSSRRFRRVRRPLRRMVRRMINRNIETKWHEYPFGSVGDQSFNSIGYGNSSVVGILSRGIIEGTNYQERIGRKIIVKALRIWLAFQPGDSHNYLRLLVVRPKGQVNLTNNANFVAQVLTDSAGGSTQWLEPVDTEKFKVYFDKTMYLRFQPLNGSTTDTTPTTKIVRKTIKLSVPLVWGAQLASAEDDPYRNLYIVGVSDSAAIPHPGAIAGNVRVYYKDA